LVELNIRCAHRSASRQIVGLLPRLAVNNRSRLNHQPGQDKKQNGEQYQHDAKLARDRPDADQLACIHAPRPGALAIHADGSTDRAGAAVYPDRSSHPSTRYATRYPLAFTLSIQ
jgi:hypothetical protein